MDIPVLDSKGSVIPHPTDSEDTDFTEWVKQSAIGDCSNMHNMLCQYFNRLKTAKDDLVFALRTDKFPKEKAEEAKTTLKDMYPMLQRIETRVFLCRDRIKELQAMPFKQPLS